MKPGVRPELRARFRAVVERAIARADQAHAEHLARLRPAAHDVVAERRRTHTAVTAAPRRRRS